MGVTVRYTHTSGNIGESTCAIATPVNPCKQVRSVTCGGQHRMKRKHHLCRWCAGRAIEIPAPNPGTRESNRNTVLNEVASPLSGA